MMCEGQGTDDGNEDAALAAAFAIFDSNHDGFIEGADLKRVLDTLGWSITDRDVQALLDTAKPSKPGKVSISVFERVPASCIAVQMQRGASLSVLQFVCVVLY
jgi:Ca2+-binding EF-hand superfamily protein